MKKIFFLLLVCTVAISCNQTKKEPSDDREASVTKELTSDELDSLNQNASIAITLNQNAISGWDTIAKYTYQLQEMLDTGSKAISFIGNINDIIKADTNYIMKVKGNYNGRRNSRNSWFAEILLSKSRYQELHRYLFKKSLKSIGCFIIKNVKIYEKVNFFRAISINSEIGSYKPAIEDDKNSVKADAFYSNVLESFDEKVFIFKGELVDFYLFKNKETYRAGE